MYIIRGSYKTLLNNSYYKTEITVMNTYKEVTNNAKLVSKKEMKATGFTVACLKPDHIFKIFFFQKVFRPSIEVTSRQSRFSAEVSKTLGKLNRSQRFGYGIEKDKEKNIKRALVIQKKSLKKKTGGVGNLLTG